MHKINKGYRLSVIISACQGKSIIDDLTNNAELGQELTRLGLRHKQVDGVYKGQVEKSYYVDCSDVGTFSLLHDLASKYNQESILNLNTKREASLIFINRGTFKSIGEFKQVGEHEAKQCDSYTYDYVNNGYYICE